MLTPCLEKLCAQTPGHLICRTLDFALFSFLVVYGDWVYRPLITWPSAAVFAISLTKMGWSSFCEKVTELVGYQLNLPCSGHF